MVQPVAGHDDTYLKAFYRMERLYKAAFLAELDPKLGIKPTNKEPLKIALRNIMLNIRMPAASVEATLISWEKEAQFENDSEFKKIKTLATDLFQNVKPTSDGILPRNVPEHIYNQVTDILKKPAQHNYMINALTHTQMEYFPNAWWQQHRLLGGIDITPDVQWQKPLGDAWQEYANDRKQQAMRKVG